MQTDEAEQVLVTQVWLWGYGSQPPLYTWLQIPLFTLLGVNLFALALLKNCLLFSIYLFTYLTGREIFRETRHALLAAFSLLSIVLFAWESQRDQTHLVLATAVATATLYTAVRLTKSRAAGWYCLLGLLAGLGVLSKYNYAVMIVSLLLAALSLPTLRPIILDRKILLTLACFVLVIAPHTYWAVTNPELLFSQANKFKIPETGSFVVASLNGTALLVKRIFEYTVGPLVLFGFLNIRAPRIAEPSADRTLVSWIQRMMIIGLILCFIAVFAFHVTSLRARWLQPLLISLPLVLVSWTQPRLDQTRVHFVFTLAAIMMLLVPLTLYGRVRAAAWFGRTTHLNTPYREFAAHLRSAGFTRGLIIAEGHQLGGNMRLQFPESTIVAAQNIRVPMPSTNYLPTLMVWQPIGKLQIPRALRQFSEAEFEVDLNHAQVQEISAPALYARDKIETLHFALVNARPKAKFAQGSAMQ
ncbi:MAG TPA: glycosyltransferase family 39 protein [Verrucomicrobiae bacterium]|nr:glycosyltransferase family 39 protein [Verrucomicrobiae bacterium]